MTHVITFRCASSGGAACAVVCPADCIHPRPAAVSAHSGRFWIDPEICIDCGLCVDVCPVGAVWCEDDLVDAGPIVGLPVPSGSKWSCC